MKKVLSLMDGFNYSLSTNANAICLYKIIKSNIDTSYIVITDVRPAEWIDLPHNLKMVYYNFSSWRKPWKLKKILSDLTEISSTIMHDWKYKNVFLISFPNLNLYLASSLKNADSQISLSLYELDPFAYNQGFRSQKLLFLLRSYIERKSFVVADRIFLNHELYERYSQSKYKSFFNKIHSLSQPTIDKELYDALCLQNVDNEVVVFSYFGTINNSFRNPLEYLEDFCDMLIELDIKYEIRFYGSDEIYLKKMSCQKKYRIKILPFISQDKYINVLEETHFLINISNKGIGDIMPSKLLEYIGTGLPIINFTDNMLNVTVNILKNYPIKFNFSLDEKEIEERNNKLREFITKNLKQRVSWKEININYSEFIITSVANKINQFYK